MWPFSKKLEEPLEEEGLFLDKTKDGVTIYQGNYVADLTSILKVEGAVGLDFLYVLPLTRGPIWAFRSNPDVEPKKFISKESL